MNIKCAIVVQSIENLIKRHRCVHETIMHCSYLVLLKFSNTHLYGRISRCTFPNISRYVKVKSMSQKGLNAHSLLILI